MSFEALSSQAIRRPETSNSTAVLEGTFAWAAVHQYNAIDTGQLKAACLDANKLYISSRKGIHSVESATGRYEEFQRADATQQLSHNLAVIKSDAGPLLWACNGNGLTSIYNVNSRMLTRKAFPVHNGEVLAVLSIDNSSSRFLISGGADFQVKSWSPTGDLLSASGHHHAAVQCLAVVPVTSPPPTPKGNSTRRTSSSGGLHRTNTASRRGAAAASSGLSTGTALKVWAGAADGTLSVCADPTGTGVLDPAGWRQFKPDGMKGARCMLLLPDNKLWVGCDDGRVFVFDGATEVQLLVFKAAPAGINCLSAVGASALTETAQSSMSLMRSMTDGDSKGGLQVWAASDKLISVHEPVTGAVLFTLPSDPDGFVKALLPWDWGIWVLSFNSLRQLAVRAAWEGLQQQVDGLGAKLTTTQQSLYDCQILSGQQAVQLQQHEQQSLAAAALQAQLEQQLLQANQQIAEQNLQLQTLQQQLQDAWQERSALQQQADAAQKGAAALAADQLAARDQQIAQTESQLAASRDEAEKYRSQLNAVTIEADAIRSQLAGCQGDLAHTQQQLTAETAALMTVKAELGAAQSKNAELQDLLDMRSKEAAVREQQAVESASQLAAVKGEVQQLKDALAARDAEVHAAQATTVTLQQQLHAAAEQHVNSTTSTEEQHQRLMADLKQQLDEVMAKQQTASANAEQLQQHTAELQEQLARVQAEEAQHLDAEVQLKAANEQLTTELAAARAAAEAATSNLEQQLEEIKQQKAELDAHLTATRQKLDEMSQILQQEQQAHQAAIEAQQELQHKVSSMEQLQQSAATDAVAHEQQLMALREETAQHQQSSADKEQQLAALISDHQLAVAQNAALTEQVAQQAQQVAEVQQARDSLQEKLQEQECAAAEAATASSMAATLLAAELAAVRGELLSANAQLQRLDEQVTAAQDVQRLLEQAHQQVRQLQQNLAESDTSNKLAAQQTQALQSQLEAIQREREQMTLLLQQAQQDLAASQQDSQQLQQQLHHCQAEADAEREAKQQLQGQLTAAKALQDDKSAAVMQELRQLQKQLSSRKRSHTQQVAEMTEKEAAATARITELEQNLTAAEQRLLEGQTELQQRDTLVQQLQHQLQDTRVQHEQQLAQVQQQAASGSDYLLQQQQELEQQVKHLQRRLSQAVREQRQQQSSSTAGAIELKQELERSQQLLQQEKDRYEQLSKDYEAAQRKMQQLQQQVTAVHAAEHAVREAAAAADAKSLAELCQARLLAVETKITDLQGQMQQARSLASAAGGAGALQGAAVVPAAAAAAVPAMMMIPGSSAAPSFVINTGAPPPAMQQQQACSLDTAAAIGAAAAAAAAAAELKAQQAESKFTAAGQQLVALTAERDELQRKLQAHFAAQSTKAAASGGSSLNDNNTPASPTTSERPTHAAAAASKLSSSLHAEVSLAEFARTIDNQQRPASPLNAAVTADGSASGALTAAASAHVTPGAGDSDVHAEELARQVEELHAELDGIREDRYQLQVALKAANKQLAVTQAQLKAVQAAAAETARQHMTELAAIKQPKSTSNKTTNDATGQQEDGDAAVRQKLAQLEGALRQASADYALILGELSKIRSEGSERQAALESALAGKAAAEAEVHRLQQLLGGLQQQLSVSAQLQKTHQGVLHRVTSAAAGREHAAVPKADALQHIYSDGNSSPCVGQPPSPAWQIDVQTQDRGSELCRRQQEPQSQQRSVDPSSSWQHKGRTGSSRDRCIPPTGYL